GEDLLDRAQGRTVVEGVPGEQRLRRVQQHRWRLQIERGWQISFYRTSQHISTSRAPRSKNPKNWGKFADQRQKTRDAWRKPIGEVPTDTGIPTVVELRKRLAQF